eukprot:UN06552
MSMILQTRIQSEMEKFQKAIHSALVPLQKSAYLCMADCSDPIQTPQQIEKCYQKCQHSIASADNHVQFTVQNFQRQIEKCDMDCQPDTNKSINNREEYESCMSSSVDKVLSKFPQQIDELMAKLNGI